MAQELKAYNVVATASVNPEVVDSLGCTDFAAYDADEVDAVLAEKDKQIAQLRGDLKDLWDDKHDTDKLLDERNTEIAELKAENESLLQQNRELCEALQVMYSKDAYDKQKYKRCLAMAKLCESEEKRLEAISPIFDTDKECWEYNSDYWERWRKRWLELAEKFKEAK